MGVLVPGGDRTAVKRTADFFLTQFTERLEAQVGRALLALRGRGCQMLGRARGGCLLNQGTERLEAQVDRPCLRWTAAGGGRVIRSGGPEHTRPATTVGGS